MFGMMIGNGAKFYRVPSPCPAHDLMDLEFMRKFYVKNASERKSAIQASCPVRRQVLLWRGISKKENVVQCSGLQREYFEKSDING